MAVVLRRRKQNEHIPGSSICSSQFLTRSFSPEGRLAAARMIAVADGADVGGLSGDGDECVVALER